MKKLRFFILCLSACLLLVGCAENKYARANELFENGDYEGALILYQELGEYEDSQNKVSVCEREIGMRENADYDFLRDIETAVLYRMDNAESEDFTTLVKTELAYVSKYENAEFYDVELGEIAKQYIDGLHTQESALKTEYEWEYQLGWFRGRAQRYEALKNLYDNYGFLNDNQEFVGTYVMQCEDVCIEADAYEAIDADILAQTTEESFEYWLDDYEFYFTLKNNTEYTYGTIFEVSFYDADGVMFWSNEAWIDDIKPDTSYVVSVDIFEPWRVEEFAWNNYYTDINW